MNRSRNALATLVMVGLVLGLLALGVSVLMPSLRSARMQAVEKSLGGGDYAYPGSLDQTGELPLMARTGMPSSDKPVAPKAVVKSFDAQIDLTPRLSIRTATPESIYEAKFAADILAKGPAAGKAECEILLPLPPQIISLAGLEITVNGDPSENVSHEGEYLVWRGHLDNETPAKIHVTYSAMGKGVYTLQKPPGKILDVFKTRLVAHKSDIRMLELSLQPNSLERKGGKTIYTWEYEKLLVARPIALDVLGIAGVDRLGELGWLGPASVVIFGLLVALLALAYRPESLTVWMLILIVGCFAGAYPLMYFLQEFVSLHAAIGGAAAAVIVIIAARALSLFGLRVGLFGGLLLPAAVMGLTVAATIYAKPAMQGVLLTIEAILTLVVAMVLLPKAQKAFASPPPPLPQGQSGTEG